jgi:hypothetical protein
MSKYIAPLLICFSQVAFAQQFFKEIQLAVKPASIATSSTPDRLFVSYRYFDGAGIMKTSMLWVDSLGTTHKIPDNDFLSKNFIQIVKSNESDYFYFIEREDKFYYLRALIINRENNDYQIPKAKILIDGYPLGCYEREGNLRLLSFHETTKEFFDISIMKLEVTNSKKFLLPVNRLENFFLVDPNIPLNPNIGRATTKIFPQRDKTIITIDSKATNSLISTMVLSLQNENEVISQLNIDEKSKGYTTSFVQENILFRITNDRSNATIRSYNIDSKTELASFSVNSYDVQKKKIWKRKPGELTDQYPISSFFNTAATTDPVLFVIPVDSSNMRICWGSYHTDSGSGYSYTHVDPNSGNLWFDLIYIMVIEPAINVGVEAIAESISQSKTASSMANSTGNYLYFYFNYDKQRLMFSDTTTIKSTAQLIDDFEVNNLSKLHLKQLCIANYNHHEYGIYFKRSKRSLSIMKFK